MGVQAIPNMGLICNHNRQCGSYDLYSDFSQKFEKVGKWREVQKIAMNGPSTLGGDISLRFGAFAPVLVSIPVSPVKEIQTFTTYGSGLLGGSFTISFGATEPTTTAPIPLLGLKASVLLQYLQQLGDLGSDSVTVQKRAPTNNKTPYVITFDNLIGDVPLLTFDYSSMTSGGLTPAMGGDAIIEIEETAQTQYLTEVKMKNLIESFGDIGTVTVTSNMEQPTFTTPFPDTLMEYTIRFDTNQGDLPILEVETSTLSPAEATVAISEVVQGVMEDRTHRLGSSIRNPNQKKFNFCPFNRSAPGSPCSHPDCLIVNSSECKSIVGSYCT
jgi:hypothetical protein